MSSLPNEYDFEEEEVESIAPLDTPKDLDYESIAYADAMKIVPKVQSILSADYADIVNNTGRWDEGQKLKLKNTIYKIAASRHIKEERQEVVELVHYIVSSVIYGVGILQPLMQDMDISEIEILGYDKVYTVTRAGRKKSDIVFESPETYNYFAQRMAEKGGKTISKQEPIADFVLANRTRVNICGGEVATRREPIITMRKPPTAVRQVGKNDLFELGAFTEEMFELMSLVSDAKMNVIISGETGSGKTTIIRMLMDLLMGGFEKVILMQDSPEIDPDDPGFPLALLQTVKRDNKPVTFFDLLKASLRMNPDRVWLGEVRGEEAAEMIEMNMAGARGTLASMHADSLTNMVRRLILLLLRSGLNIPSELIKEIVHSSVDFAYQTRIMADGTKKIVEIAEILPLECLRPDEPQEHAIRTVYRYQITNTIRDANGKVLRMEGKHVKVNDLSEYTRRKFLDFGVSVPDKFGGMPTWSN